MVPSAVNFSRMGTTVFSVSSEYPAQFARGTWNWLTNVYTVGVGSICENAIGELTTASATKIRPTATPIIRLFMHLSLGWLVSRVVQHVGRSFLVAHSQLRGW